MYNVRIYTLNTEYAELDTPESGSLRNTAEEAVDDVDLSEDAAAHLLAHGYYREPGDAPYLYVVESLDGDTPYEIFQASQTLAQKQQHAERLLEVDEDYTAEVADLTLGMTAPQHELRAKLFAMSRFAGIKSVSPRFNEEGNLEGYFLKLDPDSVLTEEAIAFADSQDVAVSMR